MTANSFTTLVTPTVLGELLGLLLGGGACDLAG